MAKFNLKEQQESIPQFIRFLIVGTSGTLIDFLILIILKNFGFHTLTANAISFSAGLVNNYYWNSHWTYKDTFGKRSLDQFLKFAVVSLLGLGFNSYILFLLETPIEKLLGIPGLGYLPAKVIATAVVLFWNYLANRKWTFNSSNNPLIKGE
ncbi:MAG: GtrA family protein [Pelolinea sp.]|nr:GtrA family protein [Pelolinea sp.]